MSAFDTFSNDGEDAGYVAYDSQSYDYSSTFVDDAPPVAAFLGDVGGFGGGVSAGDDDVPVHHDHNGSIPNSPAGYGFGGDPHQTYATAPSPFGMPDYNGKMYLEAEENGEIFVSNGSVLPDLEDMREEGFALWEWHR